MSNFDEKKYSQNVKKFLKDSINVKYHEIILSKININNIPDIIKNDPSNLYRKVSIDSFDSVIKEGKANAEEFAEAN